jgi:uncharacterized protein (DUF2249 family)/hemerythrin-like domain-containing protein
MSDANPELELRDLSQPTRMAEIRESIDALEPGDALVLVGAEVPRALLSELQSEAAGRFEWSFLEAGPERTRIELRCREDEGPRSVTGYLQADHARLDAIAEETQGFIGTGSFAEARASFGEFVCGLSWHIDAEERVLFPAFEAAANTPQGPTTVMRGEHVEIRAHMQRVTAALGAENAASAEDAFQSLIGLLGTHNMKEERMLYPMTDRALGSAKAQEELVQRIELA